MAHDQVYEAQVQRAIVHLEGAWAAFKDDPVLAWREKSGDVLRMRTRIWVDALQRTLAHAQQLERLGGG